MMKRCKSIKTRVMFMNFIWSLEEVITNKNP